MPDENRVSAEERPPKAKLPSDFKDAMEFLAFARTLYADDWGADQKNREEALEDAKFVAGHQWDDEVLSRRTGAKKPALTINRLPAFVAQLVGNRRQNRTTIKAIPTQDKNKDEAQVREAIMRSIQAHSNARRAYDVAYQNQVIGGLGVWRLELDYSDDDAFEQDIMIRQIHNTMWVL